LTNSLNGAQARIREIILKHIPQEAEISRIEFEGPNIAIYTKKPDILVDQSYIVSDIVKVIRKRIVVRSDPSIRMNEAEAEKIIRNMVTDEAEISDINFDPTIGEVIIVAKKPGLVISKDGVTLQDIIKTTKWIPRILRKPPLPSKIITHIRNFLYSESKEREQILRLVGERVFRPIILGGSDVRLISLGGFQEVGRSAMLLQTGESQVLLDCGINPGSDKSIEAFPRLDIENFNLESIDAVVISHAHMDHCGFLPFLYKYGYSGPVYCSEPTSSLMTLLQLDYLDVIRKEGMHPPYDQTDVRDTVLHTIPIKYGTVIDVAPDIRLTLHNAGHIIGSSIVHLHVGEGLHNIVYTGDYKYYQTMLLDAAATAFPRVETLITESTYGAPEDIMPARREAEEKLASIINATIERGGKVLIPVPAVGRAQEIMLVLNEYMRNKVIKEVPIYLEGMINEATAIHVAYPEYLARDLKDQILRQGINPFQSDYFVTIKHPSARQEAIGGGPSVILATSGMLEGGPSVEYFKQFAPDEKNTIIFVSYQIEGTLGRRIQKGLNEISMINNDGRIEIIKIRLKSEAIEGFSGHSDRNQILAYIRRISTRPEKVIVCHGERNKCINLANFLLRMYKLNSYAPEVLEAIKLR